MRKIIRQRLEPLLERNARNAAAAALPTRVAALEAEIAQPTVVSPASMVQIERLRTSWAATQGGAIIGDGADAPRPLVITPLVLLAWDDRAQPIADASSGSFWKDIQSALVAANGGIRFGHTNPETSNSGAQTLLLLAYGYSDARNLSMAQAQDGAFREWLAGVERAVPAPDDSTGTLMTDMLRFGPSKYDFVAVYENLAIEAMGSPAASNYGGLRTFYPPATILSDHPYVVLRAPWVTPEQRQAAGQFRDFLLSREVQQLALDQYGFRPASPQVQINPGDPASPFGRYAAQGIQLDIPPQVAVPPGDVIDALVATWRAARP
ncbi:extracellular solute-binding protein [Oscillochloris sp. ZM17-4]|uniref:substrate-binding domain-containing protein n=1 Tax=Oscillochloris sp. ZM17-4 TaxID=2866714 RepID=UPI001C72FE54|nr:substrate-binding domain-containing protein [Oscillochloris sp. ZM17-4]MBX0326542.1 extracellular solute-binding protein [Oscillochloris sp. ZM17-4]